MLFRDVPTPAPYRLQARRELHRILLELKAGAAEVRVAALRARAAQLRRAAGRLSPAA
jgi:hypothetical protein